MIEQLSFNIAVDITGVLGLFFILLSFMNRKTMQIAKSRQLFAVFLTMILVFLADLISCLIHGTPELTTALSVANTMKIVFSYMMLMLLLRYLRLDLKLRSEEYFACTMLIYGLSLFMMAAVLLNPLHGLFFRFNRENGMFEQGSWHVLLNVHSVLVIACFAVILITKKGLSWKKRLVVGYYFASPVVVSACQPLVQISALTNMAALFSTLVMFADHYMERNLTAAEQELELENAHSALVLSQIQPHFLFNSMATVMNLCDKDPQEAKEALQELSDYLHYKITAMSTSYVVSFSEDLEFLQNYVKLEKRRYGSRLNVEYDIQCRDFQIPLLTLQPLVENAIRHGISRRPEGGTVRISTWKTAKYYTILVEDNGVGFIVPKDRENMLEHVGLTSVRNRLAALCGGGLSVHSTPETGTQVEITIKEKKEAL